MKKSIDALAQRILAVGVSFAMILGVALFGFASITSNSAKADSPLTVNNSGKILMDQNSFVHNNKFYYHILAWDSESGKSKLYWFNWDSGKLKSTDYQLPTSPLY